MEIKNQIINRDSNIELLRIIAMGLITCHHFIYHGLGVFPFLLNVESYKILSQTDLNISLFANSFFIIGVNVFVLISGYFLISLKIKTVIKLFLVCSFYGSSLYLISCINENTFSYGTLISRMFFVFSRTPYWFIREYFILMLCSYPINMLFKQINQKQLVYFIFILSLINIWFGFVNGDQNILNGYNFINFILLYCLGRLLRINSIYIKQKSTFIFIFIYLLCSVIIGFLAIYLNNIHSEYLKRIFYYNNPLIIIASVSFFCIFLKIDIKSRLINYLAASSFAIYLVQDGGVNFYNSLIYSKYLTHGLGTNFLFILFIFMCLSMILPIIVDKIRIFITSPLEKYLIKKIEYVINTYT